MRFINFNTVLLILLILFLLNFLGLYVFTNTQKLIVLVPGFILGYKAISDSSDPLSNPYKLIILGLVLNSFSSFIYEGQSFYQSFNSLTNVLPLILLYYSLIGLRVEGDVVFKALTICSYIFCIFYITNYILVQSGVSLIEITEKNMERGVDARFRVMGSMLLPFLYFKSLGEYFEFDNKKSLLKAMLPLMVLLIMAFRTMIAAVALCTVIQLAQYKGLSTGIFKYILMGLILCAVLWNVPLVQEKINYMIEKQTEGVHTFDNDDYNRVISFQYFTEKHFQNPIEMFLGSGPVGISSSYGDKMRALQEYGIYPADWGILGAAWMYGFLTILGWIWYSIIMIRARWCEEARFISVLYIYMLLTSITSNEFATPGNFVIHACVLYLIHHFSINYEIE